MRWPGRSPIVRSSTGSTAPRATPGSRGTPSWSGSMRPTMPRWSIFARRSGSISWWWGRKGRWWPGSSTISKPPASRPSDRGAPPLASAHDRKRAFDGDRGPNTGGMGAYSPAPVMTEALSRRAMDEIVLPTLRAMKAMDAPFQGVLYAGLMITAQGPKLIEFNVRFGDPECQVLMLRLKSDLVPALIGARDGVLKSFDLRWHGDVALAVVMAANGYPATYVKGSAIEGLDAAAAVEGVEIFHAGTKAEGGRILADGGRVLNVCALGASVDEARKRAYAAIRKIPWPEWFCARDIGWPAVWRGPGGAG